MMQKITFFLLLVILSISCKVTKTTNADYDFMKITKQGIIQKPLVADLEVSKEKKLLSKTYENTTYDQAKNLLMAEYTKELGCDVIVHPMFSAVNTTKADVTTINITVNGYPATYKNIRNFELKDTVNFIPKHFVLINPNESDSKVSPPIAEVRKKKGVGLIILGTILTIAAIVFAIYR